MREWFFSEKEFEEAQLLKKRENTYRQVLSLMKDSGDEKGLTKAQELLKTIPDYKDSSNLSEKCECLLSDIRAEKLFQEVTELVKSDTISSLKSAISILYKLEGLAAEGLLKETTNRLKILEAERAEKLRAEHEQQIAIQKKKQKKAMFFFGSLFLLLIIGLVVWAALPGCMIHSYMSATCTEPKTCSVCGAKKGEPLGHSWSKATCSSPKTCNVCGQAKGKPLPHKWLEATCNSPKKCKVCGAVSGKQLDHDWSNETNDLPRICKLCGEMLPKKTPENGAILFSTKKRSLCKLTINNESVNYYVKLKDDNGNDVMGFFVRANQTATVSVPVGSYYVYFASGEDWYGTKYLFGESTQCSKDDEIRDFWVSNSEYMTRSYTLYEVTDGNFVPEEIDITDF